MGTLVRLRKNLGRYEKINEDVFDLEDFIVILTPKSVYKGSDFYYRAGLSDEMYIRSLRSGRKYAEIEENVFESKEFPGMAIIIKGNRVHIFLDEWERIPHRKFLESLG
ncbi:MAG: hypothetical protein NTY20_03970 [Candidatus Aenigmarchaeota archaeon]|nr:hypothetical protein [Candidatus Aenigmarchaeota archaeon]